MIDPAVLEAIDASDTDRLLGAVDRYCAGEAWDLLVELRARCREAVSRGKQVWGVEEHIRYRLVLEGPPSVAGAIVGEGEARFTLGPLPEVAASTKTWSEMAPHLPPGPERHTVAAERVVRGEVVEEVIPDVPGALEVWEPAYQVATYHRDRVEAPSPPLPEVASADLPPGEREVEDLSSTYALADLIQPWTDQSNGRCQTSAVEGDHLAAVAALGVPRARAGEMRPDLALAWMGWAAASGGAHGRRRGAAAGRYLAWWVLSVLLDLDWPVPPDLLGAGLRRLRFHWFDDGAPDTGWVLRLAVSDVEKERAWAISAADQM